VVTPQSCLWRRWRRRQEKRARAPWLVGPVNSYPAWLPRVLLLLVYYTTAPCSVANRTVFSLSGHLGCTFRHTVPSLFY
jgi:hypothetical protein